MISASGWLFKNKLYYFLALAVKHLPSMLTKTTQIIQRTKSRYSLQSVLETIVRMGLEDHSP